MQVLIFLLAIACVIWRKIAIAAFFVLLVLVFAFGIIPLPF